MGDSTAKNEAQEEFEGKVSSYTADEVASETGLDRTSAVYVAELMDSELNFYLAYSGPSRQENQEAFDNWFEKFSYGLSRPILRKFAEASAYNMLDNIGGVLSEEAEEGLN